MKSSAAFLIAGVLLSPLSAASAFGQECPHGKVPSFDIDLGEAAVAKNEFLQANCAPLAVERFVPLEGRPTRVRFSFSEKWGEVARVDIEDPQLPLYVRYV